MYLQASKIFSSLVHWTISHKVAIPNPHDWSRSKNQRQLASVEGSTNFYQEDKVSGEDNYEHIEE